jgi:hypothetical protein
MRGKRKSNEWGIHPFHIGYGQISQGWDMEDVRWTVATGMTRMSVLEKPLPMLVENSGPSASSFNNPLSLTCLVVI